MNRWQARSTDSDNSYVPEQESDAYSVCFRCESNWPIATNLLATYLRTVDLGYLTDLANDL